MAKVKFQTISPTAPSAGDLMPAPRTPSVSPIGDTHPPIPEPYEALGDGRLGEGERVHLAACEAALEELRVAFVRAGKALAVIQSARLYREEFATFEEYVETRWGMSRPNAYRLINAWPLAEALSPIGDKINEAQVRELLPVAGQHGQDAAVVVYRTVAELDGVKVTAAVLKTAASAVPERWDEGEAVEAIRARLLGEEMPEDDPVEVFAAEVGRIRASLTRRRFRARLAAVPAERRREFAAQLRELAAELESEEPQA